jgi:hypothetical protein
VLNPLMGIFSAAAGNILQEEGACRSAGVLGEVAEGQICVGRALLFGGAWVWHGYECMCVSLENK